MIGMYEIKHSFEKDERAYFWGNFYKYVSCSFVSSRTNHIAVMINMKFQVWNSIHHPGLLGVNIPGLSMVVLDDLY